MRISTEDVPTRLKLISWRVWERNTVPRSVALSLSHECNDLTSRGGSRPPVHYYDKRFLGAGYKLRDTVIASPLNFLFNCIVLLYL